MTAYSDGPGYFTLNSVQFLSRVRLLVTHGLQHARPPVLLRHHSILCLIVSWLSFFLCLCAHVAFSSYGTSLVGFVIKLLQFSSLQMLICVRLFATPWTTAHQASLSVTNSWSLLKLMSVESVMPSNNLILCHPLLLPSIFPSIRVFSNESVLYIRWPKY